LSHVAARTHELGGGSTEFDMEPDSSVQNDNTEGIASMILSHCAYKDSTTLKPEESLEQGLSGGDCIHRVAVGTYLGHDEPTLRYLVLALLALIVATGALRLLQVGCAPGTLQRSRK
jgi:hypothetical protein